MPPINLNNSITTYAAVASSNTVVDLIAENGNRVGLTIFNNSSAALYIKIDDDATTTDYTCKIAANGYYEMPKGYFTDKVTGIWGSEDGQANITEISTLSHNRD